MATAQATRGELARPGLEWWRAPPAPAPTPTGTGTANATPTARLPFAALIAFTVVLLLAPQERFPQLAPLHLAALAAAVAIATTVRQRLREARALISGREVRLALGLLAWALATLPFSRWPGGSLNLLGGELAKSVAIFWLIGCAIDSVPRLRTFAWVLTALSIPLAFTGIQHFADGSLLGAAAPELQRIDGYEAPLTANPNDLALMLNLLLPLTLALFALQRGTPRLVLAGVVGLDAVAIVATFSRAGALTLAAVLAGHAWFWRKRPERKWIWGAAVAALLCTSLLPTGYVGRLGTIADISSDPTGSAQTRWRDSLVAAQWVLDHPVVGAGLGMNALALNELRGPTWTSVHNVYLQYAADLGLPGLALFVALAASCVAAVDGLRKRLEQTDPLLALAQGIELSLGAFLIAAFFHPAGYHFYFFYVGGLAVAARRAAGSAA